MAGCYGLFGTILLAAFFVPASAPGLSASLRRLAWASLALALAAGFIWFLLQSADMASASNFGAVLNALPIVAEWTRFGNLFLFRASLAVIAMLCMQAGFRRAAALAAGVTVIAEAWLGHGGAMTGNIGTILLIASICHLAGGGAWIGSLPGLFLMVAKLPAFEAARLARRYSPFGIGCVVLLICSAGVEFFYLVRSPAALFTTLYGRVALFKILALGGLILLAAMNRYRLAPALFDSQSKSKILASVGCEIALGLTALIGGRAAA